MSADVSSACEINAASAKDEIARATERRKKSPVVPVAIVVVALAVVAICGYAFAKSINESALSGHDQRDGVQLASREAKTSGGEASEGQLIVQLIAAHQSKAEGVKEEQRKAEKEEARQRAEAERIARRDNITGAFGGSGMGSRGDISSVTFDGDEMIVEGELFAIEDIRFGASIGDKTWVFGIDGNTVYGASVNGGFQEMSRDDLEIYWAEGMFPAIHLEIENGVVKRVWQSA